MYAGRIDGGATMKTDPVIAEIRSIRAAHAAKFAGDVRAMLADMRKRQREGGRKSVTRPAKRIALAKSSGRTATAE